MEVVDDDSVVMVVVVVDDLVCWDLVPALDFLTGAVAVVVVMLPPFGLVDVDVLGNELLTMDGDEDSSFEESATGNNNDDVDNAEKELGAEGLSSSSDFLHFSD